MLSDGVETYLIGIIILEDDEKQKNGLSLTISES